MNQLIATGHVTRGALGIDLHPEFRPEDAITLGLERPRGAWVDIVHPASPAFVGGLKNGDVILRFEDKEIHDLNHLINMVSMAPIGREAELVVWRSGQRIDLKVTVGDRDRTITALASAPAPVERASRAPLPSRVGPDAADPGNLIRRPDRPGRVSSFAMGAEFQTMNETTAKALGLPSLLKGAAVLQIAPESILNNALNKLDVVYSVNGQGVSTAEELAKSLNDRNAAEPLVIGFERLNQGKVDRGTVRIP